MSKEYELPDIRAYKNCRDFNTYKKFKRQRLRKGIADCDVWNLDAYLIHIIITGLRKLAKNCIGYPGTEPFTTHESWVAYLNDLADRFEKNEDAIENGPFKEYEALHAEQVKLFTELGEHIGTMWD